MTIMHLTNPTFRKTLGAEKSMRDKSNSSILASRFQDEDAAREYLEKMRWADGVICPHCGLSGEAYKLTPKRTEQYQDKSGKWRKPRKGLWKCAGCRKQFTVTVGTIFEDGHIPVHKWLLAIHLLCSSKKGMSSHQLKRNLGIGQYKSAWFMAHRIRYAMAQEPLASKLTGIVEVDETYVGGRRKNAPMPKAGERPVDRPGPYEGKAAVLSILQRGRQGLLSAC